MQEKKKREEQKSELRVRGEEGEERWGGGVGGRKGQLRVGWTGVERCCELSHKLENKQRA